MVKAECINSRPGKALLKVIGQLSGQEGNKAFSHPLVKPSNLQWRPRPEKTSFYHNDIFIAIINIFQHQDHCNCHGFHHDDHNLDRKKGSEPQLETQTLTSSGHHREATGSGLPNKVTYHHHHCHHHHHDHITIEDFSPESVGG